MLREAKLLRQDMVGILETVNANLVGARRAGCSFWSR
jgi:hypothetical protein